MSEWMVVFETSYEPEAHVVAGRLNVEGIRAVVHRQPGAAALGITIGMLGAITVFVRPDDYDRALALLEPEYPNELPNSTDDVTYLGIEDDDPDQLPD
ncbi:MAG: DUF2007 domain-containing protein [Chloroflexi bacterium]|nr:DUF2007 domain-containing protein [Chloroflexota bacterium]